MEPELGQLIQDFFRAVSFAPGEKPAYARLTELFLPGGRLIRAVADEPEIWDVPSFVAPRQQLVDAGELTAFREEETSEVTVIFGNVAHRFSGYDKCGTQGGVDFTGRGFISTQFVRTDQGWRIASMAWDDERP